ncbi:MAG: hypothetical protein D3903_07970 [Candidatus Electrothrix sp. GM3_4]|nr:hypothetical protein [Candidatus Electrothrix sp. GM3_4]
MGVIQVLFNGDNIICGYLKGIIAAAAFYVAVWLSFSDGFFVTAEQLPQVMTSAALALQAHFPCLMLEIESC